jgi:hypothetical protein
MARWKCVPVFQTRPSVTLSMFRQTCFVLQLVCGFQNVKCGVHVNNNIQIVFRLAIKHNLCHNVAIKITKRTVANALLSGV